MTLDPLINEHAEEGFYASQKDKGDHTMDKINNNIIKNTRVKES